MPNMMRHWIPLAAAATMGLAACNKSDNSVQTSGGAVTADTSTKSIAVTDVTIGRHVDANKKVTDATDTFTPKDSVVASVHTIGNGTATLTGRWTFQDGQIVDE